jgi:protein-S-isoprenylcysteine O-methyltransferase Ste14
MTKRAPFAAAYLAYGALGIGLIAVSHRSDSLIWPILLAIVFVVGPAALYVMRRGRKEEERQAAQLELEEFRARLDRLTE